VKCAFGVDTLECVRSDIIEPMEPGVHEFAMPFSDLACQLVIFISNLITAATGFQMLKEEPQRPGSAVLLASYSPLGGRAADTATL